jgi:hypothetical protein
MNRAALRFAVLALVAAVSGASMADEGVPCADAAAQGQSLTKDHQLLEAREEFRQCSGRACPLVIKQDCVKWLDDVEQSIPTVVLTATDVAGRDLVDANVSVDGRALVSKLDGEAVAVNPGAHSFRFSFPDGTKLERSMVIKEGLKNQSVAVAFGMHAEAPSVEEAARGRPAPGPHSRSLTTLGWVVGGAGLLALGVGAAFGVTAIVENDDAHCNASRQCAPGPLSEARTDAVGADIGLIAGGVLLAGGFALVVLTPKGPRGTSLAVDARPGLGPGRAGFVLEGRF